MEEENKINVKNANEIAEKEEKVVKKVDKTITSSKDDNLDELNLNTLNLKFANCSDFSPSIWVDGKRINTKKDNYGNLTYTHKTEKSIVEVKIAKYYDILGKFWFLTSLFFFIISIFGIFDLKPDKKCLTLNTTLKLKIEKQSEIKIIFKNRKKDEKALEFENTSCEMLDTNDCVYTVDNLAKKRYNTMKKVKIALWIILVVALFSLIFIL